jgi:phospholipid/cholesterol/gamma-HCH transport system substrate-binding protein
VLNNFLNKVMKTKGIDNAKLGLFVLTGLVFLVFSLYMIGSNRNIFGSTFIISAKFYNVNGLMAGNNVRFSGIDVGTVKKLELDSDTSVNVVMVIDEKVRRFIKVNAIASVGTDGLMGNKLININAQLGNAAQIKAGDVLATMKPVETDEMLRTLSTTNENIAIITEDLKKITLKINSSNSLWSLLSDTTIAKDIKDAVLNIKTASKNASNAVNEIGDLAYAIGEGDGLLGTLISDTTLSYNLSHSLGKVDSAASQLSILMTDLQQMALQIKDGKGTAGAILYDSLMTVKLNTSLDNIEQGTARFNENMEALKHNFLFRRYFKKLEKQSKEN